MVFTDKPGFIQLLLHVTRCDDGLSSVVELVTYLLYMLAVLVTNDR